MPFRELRRFNVFPLGRCRETRYPSNETGLVRPSSSPWADLFLFHFVAMASDDVVTRTIGFLVVASGMGR